MTDYESEVYNVPVSIQSSRTSSNVTIQYPTTENPVYTWNEEQTLNQLGGIVVLPPTPLQKAVFGRITQLTELAIEDGINMSPSSFRDLWSFISKRPEMRRPSVFALDNGNFRAEWKNQKGEMIGLEFCGNQIVKFVIFGYVLAIGQIMRIAGSQMIDQVQGHVEAAFAGHLLKN
jgi:hypothetical protein